MKDSQIELAAIEAHAASGDDQLNWCALTPSQQTRWRRIVKAAIVAASDGAVDVMAKLPIYADTGGVFVPEVDPAWMCNVSGHPCNVIPSWDYPDKKWKMAGRDKFYSTSDAALSAHRQAATKGAGNG